MVEHLRSGLDATYGALAHPIRRAMVGRLGLSDSRVTDLAAGFEVSLAASSRHIQVLEAAGLIKRSVHGREHELSLEPSPLADAAAFIETYRAFWERRLDALDRMLGRHEP